MIAFRVFLFGVVIFLSQGFLSNATKPFSWLHCSLSGDKAVEVLKVNIYPHPIIIPGNVTITIQAKILKPIYPTAMFKVDISRFLLGQSTQLGCIDGIINCYYDACGLVNQSLQSGGPDENSIIGQALHKFVLDGADLTCPIQPQTIGIYDFVVPIHEDRFTQFIYGDYEVRVTLINGLSGEEIGCVEIKDTISQPFSSGFLFG